jgi:hypothetical protein
LSTAKEIRMSQYGAYSDEFYVNLNLITEMELPSSRDTLLHFFEQLKKHFPTMRNFYGRERGEYILEEDKDSGKYRWATVEAKRICSGYVNPPSLDDAIIQHAFVLDILPYSLSVSPLDCESLNLMFGFDFAYRGNHNELLAEALGMTPAFEKMLEIPGSRLVANEPTIQLSLDEDCRTQFRLSIESRTSAYHVRTGEFPEEQLSVYLTIRRYGSLDNEESFTTALEDLRLRGGELLDNYIIENVLVPLQQTIAIK